VGGKGRPARKADNLPPSVSRLSRENVAASTSHNCMGLHGPLQGYLYLLFTFLRNVGRCTVFMCKLFVEFHLHSPAVTIHVCLSVKLDV
jgi:hypothetical protein